ncbi:MAG TPA: hypothetical protein DCZ69_04280 [Syntrophobacteraceae bacterium]|nr:hypothetical protein [Syntrophobacteraceae bacterium]
MSITLVALLAGMFAYVSSRRRLEFNAVDYFKEHQQERLAMLKECRQNRIPAHADTPKALNCRAAELAQQSLLFTHKDPREGKTYRFDFGAPEIASQPEDNSSQTR